MEKLENIEHTTITTSGTRIHVASSGSGPAILFLHGFPELWYSWRHQIKALSALGYRCVAPDLRGYGDSDAPPSAASYSPQHIVGDLVGVLDHLGLDKVFLVGHDWGAMIAWYFCLFRPDRVNALVNLGVSYLPRSPENNALLGFKALFGDDFYIVRFQEPTIEEEFAAVDTKTVLKIFYTSFGLIPMRIPKETGFKGLKAPEPLPSWLTDDYLDYCASKFTKTGFTGGLNYYRAINLAWELTAPWAGAQIKVPTKFIVGEEDSTYSIFPGVKEYIESGGFKRDVPLLEEVVVIPGAAHFINQAKPDEISAHIYDFIKKF